MRTLLTALALALLCVALCAQGTDILVDATGQQSSLTTISQAMLQASPGDRILVLPGTYPPFLYDRGVQLIGLGATPGDVVIERIAYHVSLPATGYDTLISNLTIDSSDPLEVLVLSGNELPPGVLILDSVEVRGGVFLRGGQQGFYLLAFNCRFAPPPGHGFSGEAAYLGGPGNFVELHNSEIRGWDADASVFAPAGAALRLAGGTMARIYGSQVVGGQGQAAFAPFDAGGDGILWDGLLAVDLRIDGGSVVAGGDGPGPGGNGVTIHGNIVVADASVSGGNGNPPGQTWPLSQPTSGLPGLALSVFPPRAFAQSSSAAGPGDTVSFQLGTPAASSLILTCFALDLPGSDLFFAVEPQNLAGIHFGNAATGVVPDVPGLDFQGLMLYAQGAWYEQAAGRWHSSGVSAVRIDL